MAWFLVYYHFYDHRHPVREYEDPYYGHDVYKNHKY